MAKKKKQPQKKRMTPSQIIMGVVGIFIILAMILGMFRMDADMMMPASSTDITNHLLSIFLSHPSAPRTRP